MSFCCRFQRDERGGTIQEEERGTELQVSLRTTSLPLQYPPVFKASISPLYTLAPE